MSNRNLKLILHKQNPNCHWCNVLTKLTNDAHIKGVPEPTMATVDHVISRFDLRRWVKQQDGEQRKVLACFKCNNDRSKRETARLRAEELKRRGNGWCLNKDPNGKTIIKKPLENIKKVVEILQKHGNLPTDFAD